MANPIVEAFITTHTVHYYDDALMEIKDVRALIAQLIPADSVLVPRNTCEYMLGVVEGRIAAVDRYPESPAVREAKDHCTKFRQAIGYPVGTWLPNPGPAAEPKCKTCKDTKQVQVGDSENHHASENIEPCPDCYCSSCEGTGIAETGFPSADGESITYVQRRCPDCVGAQPERVCKYCNEVHKDSRLICPAENAAKSAQPEGRKCPKCGRPIIPITVHGVEVDEMECVCACHAEPSTKGGRE